MHAAALGMVDPERGGLGRNRRVQTFASAVGQMPPPQEPVADQDQYRYAGGNRDVFVRAEQDENRQGGQQKSNAMSAETLSA